MLLHLFVAAFVIFYLSMILENIGNVAKQELPFSFSGRAAVQYFAGGSVVVRSAVERGADY
ncbi:MAG: hypothetical protein JXA73_19870 [Acidobacteria bacterium]|nr:hypothetical protein [Acidobacteriota bacterium]